MEDTFAGSIDEDAKPLFKEDELDVLVVCAQIEDGSLSEVDPAVKVVHRSSGTSMAVDEFSTHVENHVAALIRLKFACASSK